jgi:hypothetical protein
MENGEAVDQAAREALDQHGKSAVSILRERAELADQQGDELSAKAWRDIAEAAERMLERRGEGDRAELLFDDLHGRTSS